MAGFRLQPDFHMADNSWNLCSSLPLSQRFSCFFFFFSLWLSWHFTYICNSRIIQGFMGSLYLDFGFLLWLHFFLKFLGTLKAPNSMLWFIRSTKLQFFCWFSLPCIFQDGEWPSGRKLYKHSFTQWDAVRWGLILSWFLLVFSYTLMSSSRFLKFFFSGFMIFNLSKRQFDFNNSATS